MLLLAPTTSIAVGKALLVPVAERRWLGLGKDRYRPSSGSRLLPTLNGPAGVLICYEDAYAGPVANGAREGAQWLINASNDGWLGPTHGADLHLAAARLAATETRLWAVRPTTTGHSALIAPDGAIVWQAPWSESGDGFIENGTIYRRKITYSGAMLHPFPSLAAAIILVVWSLKRTKSSTNQQLAGSSSLEG